MSFQMATIVVVPFILPESCRWLMEMGRKEKMVKILKKIARINKKQVPDSLWTEVGQLCDKKSLEKNSYTYLDLFRTPKMRRISVLAILMWMVTSCVFDTTVRNISNLNFEFYLSFMITTGLELPADLASIPGINWLGRRCVSCLFRSTHIYTHSHMSTLSTISTMYTYLHRWSSSLSLALTGVTMLLCAFTTGRGNSYLILLLI